MEATQSEKIKKIKHYNTLRKYSAISMNEIAKDLGIDRSNVERYMKAVKKESFKPIHLDVDERLNQIGKSYIRHIIEHISKLLEGLQRG